MSIYAFPIPSHTHFGTMVYEDFLSDEEINRLLESTQHEPMWEGGVVRGVGDQVNSEISHEVRRVDIQTLWVQDSNMWLFDKLSMAVADANTYYNYQLTGFMEHMQLLHYSEPNGDKVGGFYDWHQDVGAGELNTRKLTCIIQLTDPSEYDGCEVEVMGWGAINKKKGALTIFPSFTSHRVTSLTRGHRDSVVAWVNGHPFR